MLLLSISPSCHSGWQFCRLHYLKRSESPLKILMRLVSLKIEKYEAVASDVSVPAPVHFDQSLLIPDDSKIVKPNLI